MTITCALCGIPAEARRVTRRFCSDECSRRARMGYPKVRACRQCGVEFEVLTRGDANRWHCSKRCAKATSTKTVRGWQESNPEAMRRYADKWQTKNPGYYKDKARRERLAIIALLGGACVVCSVTSPYWLHVDYIPTTRDMRFRHPRNIGYVKRNVQDFRLLCANHHYELTLTGRIEGTDISQ